MLVKIANRRSSYKSIVTSDLLWRQPISEKDRITWQNTDFGLYLKE